MHGVHVNGNVRIPCDWNIAAENIGFARLNLSNVARNVGQFSPFCTTLPNCSLRLEMLRFIRILLNQTRALVIVPQRTLNVHGMGYISRTGQETWNNEGHIIRSTRLDLKYHRFIDTFHLPQCFFDRMQIYRLNEERWINFR